MMGMVPLLLLLLASSALAEDEIQPLRRNGSIDESSQNRELEEYLAKVRDWTPRRDEGELPIGLTDEEAAAMAVASRSSMTRAGESVLRRAQPQMIPPSNPRFVPEWAPMRGVLIRYPFGLGVDLIKAMSDSVAIYCLVSSRHQDTAEATLERAGVDPSSVEWILGDTDSYWTRDYGPWFVYADDAVSPGGIGGLAIVNHEYNRPRRNDNATPLKVANHMGLPYFDAGIVGTGGNMMTDGLGQAAAAHIVYTENGSCGTGDDTSVPLVGCDSVNAAMRDYFGVGVFNVVADPNGDYIDHIDCWAKYLSPDTVLMREVPTHHPRYDEIEQVAKYLRNVATTSDGGKWNMVRVMTAFDQPYTNALILNDRVFVPVVGSAADKAALQVYRDAMPGYAVSGWRWNWRSTDALHCRVRGIPAGPAPTVLSISDAPSAAPTDAPSRDPSDSPSGDPSDSPSGAPSKAPSEAPRV